MEDRGGVTVRRGARSGKITTLHIGRAGELLVQYRLLCRGIDSAPMSTDAGVDLVAYVPRRARAITIQVKTNWQAKPGGGRGKAALDWWIAEDTPALLIALVDLSSERIWLLTREELSELAQQKSSGRWHLYMYTDPEAKPRSKDRAVLAREFQRFELAARVEALLEGLWPAGEGIR